MMKSFLLVAALLMFGLGLVWNDAFAHSPPKGGITVSPWQQDFMQVRCKQIVDAYFKLRESFDVVPKPDERTKMMWGAMMYSACVEGSMAMARYDTHIAGDKLLSAGEHHYNKQWPDVTR